MNNHYYKEACMCRNPMPSRIVPERCAWCGGILPPAVRALHRIEREMDDIPTGGAIVAVVLVAIALLVLSIIGNLTLMASQHDPNPPFGAIESPAPEEVATGD